MKAFARMTCQAVALRRLILVSSLALAAAGSGGCFSIKLDGEVREDVSYRVGFEDGIEVISLDDIEMLVTRAKDFAISVNGGTWIKDQDGAFLINARYPEEDVSIAIATIPKKPQEICSKLKYKDWLYKKFTVRADKTKFGSDKME